MAVPVVGSACRAELGTATGLDTATGLNLEKRHISLLPSRPVGSGAVRRNVVFRSAKERPFAERKATIGFAASQTDRLPSRSRSRRDISTPVMRNVRTAIRNTLSAIIVHIRLPTVLRVSLPAPKAQPHKVLRRSLATCQTTGQLVCGKSVSVRRVREAAAAEMHQ